VLTLSLLPLVGCDVVMDLSRFHEAAPPAIPDSGLDGEVAPVPDAGAGVPAGPWGCLSLPNEALDPNLHVTVTLQLFDALKTAVAAGAVDGGSDLTTVYGTWLPGVAVRVCSLLDPKCTSGSAPVLTDDAGEAVLDLTGTFAGYLEFSRSDLVPWSLYPQNLLAGQTATSLPSFGLTPTGFRLAAGAVTPTPLSFDPDGGLGHAFVQIFDCQDHQASGVRFAYSNLGTDTVAFYLSGGLPSTSAPETDAFGVGGVLNAPTGSLTVTAALVDGDRPLGSANITINPGAITEAFIRVRSH
jgi:hypothetical protein